MTPLEERLSTYPGRGLFAFRAPDLSAPIVGYFITGRSQSSRERQAIWDGDVLAVASTSANGIEDPLRHYAAAVRRPSCFVLGNGEQVSLMDSEMQSGAEFGATGANLSFEPDPPIFTPRITVALTPELGIEFISHRPLLVEPDPLPERCHYVVGEPIAGVLYLMTTYRGSLEAPTPAGELEAFDIGAIPADEILTRIWESLSRRIRVLLIAFSSIDGSVGKVGQFGSVVHRSSPSG
jgi:hypothetical protein